ncbi:MAG: hypoxanthine phosphoribosyltransferase, partial [Candidatus Celaenobacter antarcticus]|nr:hypoxanthine phosphoribosyltransferase [Candidatus Celaenobacter antarcticus]
MHNDIERILFSEQDIKKKVKELGEQISRDYKDKNPILINILKGGVVFLADIIRSLNIPIEIEFMGVASYGNSTKSSGVVQITKDCNVDISDRHVLIIEDIVDTGLSLNYITRYLQGKNPKSLKMCVLLDKVDSHEPDIGMAYKAFEVPNEFIVGYGLDYDEKYRNLPYIGILK